jgi:hypothetical protein
MYDKIQFYFPFKDNEHSTGINANWMTFPIQLSQISSPNISRANTTRGLDYEHMIKERAHKEGVRIGKTPKKLASICCP